MFAVASHHPLAESAARPIDDALLLSHRAVAVADSAQRLSPATVNLLPGRDVLTVASMQAKIEAQARGLGCGVSPEPMVRVGAQRPPGAARRATAHQGGALRLRLAQCIAAAGPKAPRGLALQWWLQLKSPATRPRAARAPWRPLHAEGRLKPWRGYCGRFAPSPTGPLHAGSLVAALASWLMPGPWRPLAGAHRGCRPAALHPGAEEVIPSQLAACGLHPDDDEPRANRPVARRYQARGSARCRAGAYPCACTRREIEDALVGLGCGTSALPRGSPAGTCRAGLNGKAGSRHARADSVRRHRIGDRLERPAAGAPARRTWPVKWATSSCAAPMACGPTSWRWSSTTPSRHHRRGAGRRPGRQHGASDPSATAAEPASAALPAHPGAGTDGHKLSKQNQARPWTPPIRWPA